MKYLHTMIRISNIEKSLNFYCKGLGLKETRREENEKGRYTLIFLAAPNDESAEIELTYNWDQKENYDKGNGWGHVCIETPNVYKACEDLSAQGVNITRKPGPMKHGTRVIAFCEDPDGYKVELNEKLKI